MGRSAPADLGQMHRAQRDELALRQGLRDEVVAGVAGKGRYFDYRSTKIRASVDFAEEESPLCTSLCKDGVKIRIVEHLFSALEAMELDNCRIQIENSNSEDSDELEVSILDGLAGQWVEAIEQVGLQVATDHHGDYCEKMAAYVNEPVNVWRKDPFVAAFPSK